MAQSRHNANNPIQAIILAAGRGKRLGALTASTPKCLLSVGGIPILGHELRALSENGIRDITIVVGFMADPIQEYAWKHFPDTHFSFVHNDLHEHTNTLYSLALAAEKLKQGKQILLMNGDVVF